MKLEVGPLAVCQGQRPGTGCFPEWGLKHTAAARRAAPCSLPGTGCFPEWGLKPNPAARESAISAPGTGCFPEWGLKPPVGLCFFGRGGQFPGTGCFPEWGLKR